MEIYICLIENIVGLIGFAMVLYLTYKLLTTLDK